MSEINMLEYEEMLRKTRYKRLLKNKKALVSLGVLGANIYSLIISDYIFINVISAFIASLELQSLKASWSKLIVPEETILIEKIKSTETFKECYEEYNKYIEKVATLIRQLEFTSSKEAIAYLELLMTSGHFSKYHNHQYKIYKYHKPELKELSGARILTGKSVCRHQSSFFVDVLNTLGYPATNLSVIATSSNPIKLVKSHPTKWNHSVVSVAENNKMYIYDPTCGDFSAKPTDIPHNERESILVSQFVTSEKNYLVINPSSSQLNKEPANHFYGIIASPQMTITSGEVEYIKRKAELVYIGNSHNQHRFFLEQEEQREKIEKMYQELCPYSDKPIKKWLIHK